MNIGDRIKFLRKQKNLKRTELAKILDVPVPTLRDWEKNQSLGKSLLDKLIPLSTELGVSISQLLNGEDDHLLSKEFSTYNNYKNIPEYCKIHLLQFLRFNSTDCDLYIKLSDQKYVKIINKNDLYTTDDIIRYKQKGIHEFYVRGCDYIPFVENLLKVINLKISNSHEAQEHHSSIFLTVTELTNQLMNSMGINEQTKKTIEQVIDNTVQVILKNQKISELFKKLTIGNNNYIYEHSLLLSYLTSGLSQLMNYSSESIMHKMTLASFLHDLSLEQEHLAKLRSLEGLSIKEKQIVLAHPAKAAEIALTFSEMHMNVDKIILDHHETYEGDGFPRQLNHHQIGPLQGLFIICHDIVDLIYDSSREQLEPKEFKHIIDSITNKYSSFLHIKNVSNILSGLNKLSLNY